MTAPSFPKEDRVRHSTNRRVIATPVPTGADT